LSDIGISRQLDGSLTVDTTKLTAAANNGTELQKLFTTKTGNSATEGVALKFADYANGALAASGAVTDEQSSLARLLAQNTKDQDQVNAHVDAVAASLSQTYSALDGTMASLNALSAYVSQQVTSWNKATS
jgi:flagellar hook-associated protein 2